MNRKLHNRWLVVGGIMGFLAVAFGAFGAHGIEEVIPSWYGPEDIKPQTDAQKSAELPQWYQLNQLHREKLDTWITGVRYHFYHALAMIAVGLTQLCSRTSNRLLDASALLFLLGTIGFSGSIYLYVITKIKIFGMTAALGGTTFLAGWVLFLCGVIKLSGQIDDDSSKAVDMIPQKSNEESARAS